MQEIMAVCRNETPSWNFKEVDEEDVAFTAVRPYCKKL
jgi:hypothetical protein